jgi:hypothetical protein
VIVNIWATDIGRFFREISDDWVLFRVRTGLPVGVTLVLLVTIAQGDLVSLRESKQAAFFYPPQHGYLTYAAVPGYGPGCQVLGVVILHLVHLYFPPYS